MRVHELAKQLNVLPKDMITVLHDLGFMEIKNNFNAVSAAGIRAATEKVQGPSKPNTPVKPKVAIHRPAPVIAPPPPPSAPTPPASNEPEPVMAVEPPTSNGDAAPAAAVAAQAPGGPSAPTMPNAPTPPMAPAAQAPSAPTRPASPGAPTPVTPPPLRPAQIAAQAHRSVTPPPRPTITPPLPPMANERGPVPQFRSTRPAPVIAPPTPQAPAPAAAGASPTQAPTTASGPGVGGAGAGMMPRPMAPQPRPMAPMPRPNAPHAPSRPVAGAAAPAAAPGSGAPKPGHPPGAKRDSWRDKEKENTQKLYDQAASKRGRRKGRGDRNHEEAAVNQATLTKIVKLSGSVTVKELADKMGVRETEIIKRLFMKGLMATINQTLELETAEMIAVEMEYTVEMVSPDEVVEAVVEEEQDTAGLKPRPPVVTIMGHVDHGKTSLLDAIRKTNVTAGEAGGITQHIGAYQVKLADHIITFLDTPGHEAFTAMRARGAKATDVAILVVAADDGVKPQTIEAINHAKEAGVQILVAINKIDKPGADPENVKRQLTEYGLVAEEWGGQTVMVPVSAKQKTGLDTLLEMILLVSEVLELKANPKKPARGLIIEAQLDKGMGPVATVLVQNGTLHVGDNFVVGAVAGKVRAMINDHGKRVREAGPAMPVEVLGMPTVPMAGDIFQVVDDEKTARTIANQRAEYDRTQRLQATRHVSLTDVYSRIQEGKIKDLKVILKSDVKGSAEALEASLSKITAKDGDVQVRVIHSGTGDISEADVMLAAASEAIVIGFNVKADDRAKARASADGVDIREYNIIYKAIEDMEAAIKGMLEPEYEEVFLGKAEVRAIFKVGKQGIIAGCMVKEGKIQRGALAKVYRAGKEIYKGKVDSLKRFKDDAREVATGYECGIAFDDFNDLIEGDIIDVSTLQVKQ